MQVQMPESHYPVSYLLRGGAGYVSATTAEKALSNAIITRTRSITFTCPADCEFMDAFHGVR